MYQLLALLLEKVNPPECISPLKSTIDEKQNSIYINAGGAGQRCLGDLLRQELAWTLEQV